MAAEASPFPSEESTPPVTKMNLRLLTVTLSQQAVPSTVYQVFQQPAKSTRPRRSGAQIRLKYSREHSDVKAAGLRPWRVQFPFSLAISQGLSYSGVTAESDFRRSIGVLDFRQGLGISLFPSEPSVHIIAARTVRPFPSLSGGETFNPAIHHLFRACAARAEEAVSPWLWLDA